MDDFICHSKLTTMRRPEPKEETKWEVKSLNRLCDLLNGLAFKPEDWTEFGLPIIRIHPKYTRLTPAGGQPDLLSC